LSGLADASQLDIPKAQLARRYREEFDKYRMIKDLPTIDMLIYRGKFELDEAKNLWKQKIHVLNFFSSPKDVGVTLPRMPKGIDEVLRGSRVKQAKLRMTLFCSF
jgi:hypothetical protein